MKLQFSISELSSYLDEIFPQVVDQYRIVELQPDFARVAQNVKTENLRPGGTVSGPAIFALLILECIFCSWLILEKNLLPSLLIALSIFCENQMQTRK